MRTSFTGDGLSKSRFERWAYALKPASWPKLLVPALFGQALGASEAAALRFDALAWGVAFTFFGLGFIVLLNDWGDRAVDAIKRKMFPDGCSPKTIPDHLIDARSIAIAGIVFGAATLLVSACAERFLSRPFAFEAGLACMLLFVAYTLPPVRLNYRGGGELLEMTGVGVALPLYNAYLQAGSVELAAWPWILGFSVLSLASGVASGLSDEESDRVGGKRTFASTRGNAAARKLTEALVVLGAGIWLLGSLVAPSRAPLYMTTSAALIISWNFAAMRRVSQRAATNAFREQAEYKRFLHRAIWHSTALVAVLLCLRSVFS
jgi:1,4-dihydroxy-2-naphthoate octaprenyltransferase/chlorophyll synthase